jgi:DNA gyrase subunit A
VCIESVREGQEILVITKDGNVIRLGIADINMIGRDTQGVRVIRLNEGDLVTDVAVVEGEDVDPDALKSAEQQKAVAAEAASALDGVPSDEPDAASAAEGEAAEAPDDGPGPDGEPA